MRAFFSSSVAAALFVTVVAGCGGKDSDVAKPTITSDGSKQKDLKVANPAATDGAPAKGNKSGGANAKAVPE